MEWNAGYDSNVLRIGLSAEANWPQAQMPPRKRRDTRNIMQTMRFYTCLSIRCDIPAGMPQSTKNRAGAGPMLAAADRYRTGTSPPRTSIGSMHWYRCIACWYFPVKYKYKFMRKFQMKIRQHGQYMGTHFGWLQWQTRAPRATSGGPRDPPIFIGWSSWFTIVPGIVEWNFRDIIFKLISTIDG